MRRIKVASEQVVSIGYDAPTLMLEIELRDLAKKDISIYQYFGISPELQRELVFSENIAKFFNSKIKNNFKYKKIK